MKKQDVTILSNLLKSYFDAFLSMYDFVFLNEELERHHLVYLYVKENLYIKFEINLYPQDFPNYFRIILGEGSLDFPESDWNSTALWRMAQVKESSSQAGYFTIKNIDDVINIQKNALDDLEKVGKDFLNGNLETFIIARKNQNIKREPYKIYSKDKDRQLQTKYDPEIIELKRKYS